MAGILLDCSFPWKLLERKFSYEATFDESFNSVDNIFVKA
jgi:hypothetical protein